MARMSVCAADTHSAGVGTVLLDTGTAVVSRARLARRPGCSWACARTSCSCDAAAHLKQHVSGWVTQRQQHGPYRGQHAAFKRRFMHVAPVPRTPCVFSFLDPARRGAFWIVCKMESASPSHSSLCVDDDVKRPHSHVCHAPFPPLKAAITMREAGPY